MFFEGVFKAVALFGSVIIAGVMTMVIIGAVYANRKALPVVGAFFGVLVVFVLLWQV